MLKSIKGGTFISDIGKNGGWLSLWIDYWLKIWVCCSCVMLFTWATSEHLWALVTFPSWLIMLTFLKRKTLCDDLNTTFNYFYFYIISTSLHPLENHLLPWLIPKQSIHGSTTESGSEENACWCVDQQLLALAHYFFSGQQARRNSWGQVVGSHPWSIRRSMRGAS